MNRQILAHDSDIKLSTEDAQALADATVALQRAEIERLLDEKMLAGDLAHLANVNHTGSRKEWNQLLHVERALRKAQEAALKAFARSRGMRLFTGGLGSANWDLLSLRDDEYSKSFCEICGFACGRGYRESDHANNFRWKNGLTKIGRRQLHAIFAHSRQPFEKVAAFATDVRLNVECIGWSLHGPEYTAVLFTRGGKS